MLRNGANGDWIGTFQGHKVSLISGSHAPSIEYPYLAMCRALSATALCAFMAPQRVTGMRSAMWPCVLNSTAVLGSRLGVCSCHRRACCDVVLVRLLGFQGAVWSCVLNSTAMLAATASADFSAKLWDAITGNELHTLQHSHIARVCQFAERSSQLITGGVRLPLSISPDPALVQSCFPRHGTAQSCAQHSKPHIWGLLDLLSDE